MYNKTAYRFLTNDDKKLLKEKAVRYTYQDGEVILREGTSKRALYLLHSGRVRVEKDYLGEIVPVTTLEAEDIFGIMSFLDDSPISASVVAEEGVVIDYLDGVTAFALFTSVPGLSSRFYQSVATLLSARLRESMENVQPPFLD